MNYHAGNAKRSILPMFERPNSRSLAMEIFSQHISFALERPQSQYSFSYRSFTDGNGNAHDAATRCRSLLRIECRAVHATHPLQFNWPIMADSEESAILRRRVAELERQLADATIAAPAAALTRAEELLSIDQFRAVFQNFSGGMAFSREGIIFEANEGLARMLQTSTSNLIGKPIVELVAPEDRELVRSHILAGYTSPYEHRLLRADGTTLPVEAAASLIPSHGVQCRFTVVRDISDRVAAEEALQQERNLLRVILENLPAGVFVVEVPSGRPVLVNEFNRQLLRRTEIPNISKDQLAKTYSVFIAGTDQLYPIERMPIARAMSGERTSVDDMELRFEDGTSTQLQVNGAPIYNQAGKVSMSVAITQDITARKRAEEQLHDEQDFLRAMIKAHERDRQLLAYEVHDGLVQYITAAVWHIESVLGNGQIDEAARKTLVDSQGFLRTAMSEARRVLSGLRPPVLDERGIIPAMEYLVAENSAAGGPRIELSSDVHFHRLDPLLEGTIFRIVQESLTNVRKHSRATAATIRLTEQGGRLQLTIEDNGCGFETCKRPGDHFGLQGIAKRAELIGGSAHIESKPGYGTKVSVNLPSIAAAETPSYP
jgi:PAS domain S-box-containing protein